MWLHLLNYGEYPNPLNKNEERSINLKEETRDFMLRIRVNSTELEKIKFRAKKTGKTISNFMRESALGCEIKERPDRAVYDIIIKPLNDFMKVLNELERSSYWNESFDERILKDEIKKWQEYRTMIRERLW